MSIRPADAISPIPSSTRWGNWCVKAVAMESYVG